MADMEPQLSAFAPPQELRWLFFDLNSYFASVEQQDRPELRGKPVAVVPMRTDSTCAIAASYEAKRYGIKTGTKIYAARRLCPDLICVLARHDVYVRYHHQIMAEVERHIPIEKICSIDEAACLLMTNERDPAVARRLALDIKRGLRERVGAWIRCSIGIAPNMFLAKTATDMQKPDGLVVLEPGKFAHRLFRIGLTDLCGVGRNMERRLNRAGIYDVEQFWNLSPRHARQIWGSVGGERMWYRLHGYDLPDAATQKRAVGHSRVLDPQHRPSDKAHAMARLLAVKACARLRRYGLHAGCFSLGVRLVAGGRWQDKRTFFPAQDNSTVLQALETLWLRMQRETLKGPIKKVSVVLHDLSEREHLTPDLFETAEPAIAAKRAGLSRAMDALNRRYGANTVSLGLCPKTSAGYVGTKIAFSRVPELAEFDE